MRGGGNHVSAGEARRNAQIRFPRRPQTTTKKKTEENIGGDKVFSQISGSKTAASFFYFYFKGQLSKPGDH